MRGITLCLKEYVRLEHILLSNIVPPLLSKYSPRRLIRSQIIESAALCNPMLLVPLYGTLYPNSTQKRRLIG